MECRLLSAGRDVKMKDSCGVQNSPGFITCAVKFFSRLRFLPFVIPPILADIESFNAALKLRVKFPK